MARTALRTVHVAGQAYVWTLRRNTLYGRDRHIVVQAPGQPGRLRIDPYAWGFRVRPASIIAAIGFALAQGWSPQRATPMYLSYENGAFIELPPGIEFAYQRDG